MKHLDLLQVYLSSLVLALICLPCTARAISMPEASVYPVMSPKISSNFGHRRHPIKKAVRHHDGIDLAAPKDSPVRAISKGMVIFADPYGGYGNLVVIKHEDGITTHYGHLNSIKAIPGQEILAGQILGTVGSTGRSTGPHLHLEFRKNGKALDPKGFLRDLHTKAEG